MASFVDQMRVMLWRNYLLKRRGWKTTLQELLLPLLLVLIVVLLSLAVGTDRRPAVDNFAAYNLSRPEFTLKETTPILAAPARPTIRDVTERVVSLLNVTGPGRQIRLYNDVTSEEIDEHYGAQPSFAEAAVEFLLRNEVVYGYVLRLPWHRVRHVTKGCSYKEGMGQCNEASGLSSDCPGNEALTSGLLQFQYAVETALVQTLVNPSFDPPALQVQMMPAQTVRPGTTRLQLLVSIAMVIALAPLAYYLAWTVTGEREGRHRMMLRIMGLRDTAFWLSWLLVMLVSVVAVSAVSSVLVLVGGLFHNVGLLFFFLLVFLYGTSLITIAFLTAAVFTKAKIAGGVSAAVTVLSSLLYLAVSMTRSTSVVPPGGSLTGSGVPFGGQVALSLCSPVAFALGLDHAIFLDEEGQGGSVMSGQFPVMMALLMLLLDTVLYGLMAVYLDSVLDSEHKASRRPWFCFSPSYWAMDVDSESAPNGTPEGPHIEPLPEETAERRTVRIRDLTKTFSQGKEGSLCAVNGLDLDVCEGQITCVLGHSGAGKTTLMRMMTGTVSPSSGSAFVYSLTISSLTNQTNLSGMIGYCPQHDVMSNNLTVEEHMIICARIKGVAKENLEQQVSTALGEIGLTSKRHCLVRKLSGVDKRKLSLAMALLGNWKVLLLDEPSSGLDPASRRQLWGVLQARKQDRVVLFTTHHMDEADILADRKAVLSKGRLRCVGSSAFLKQKFGVGYHLRMTLGPNGSTDRVLRAIKSHVRGAVLESCEDQERSFTIPPQQAWKLAALFKKLESSERGAEYLDIKSYSIFRTTLEEVFLKLAEEEEAGNVFISPLLTPAADDVFDEEEEDNDEVTRRASQGMSALPRPATSSALGELNRRLSLMSAAKAKRASDDSGSRRRSAFPRLQNPADMFQRSVSEDERLPGRGSKLTRRISSIFTKSTNRPQDQLSTSASCVNFEVSFDDLGGGATARDKPKRRSLISESLLRRKKDRSRSFQAGDLPKSKTSAGLMGLAGIDESEEKQVHNGIIMPTTLAARRATVAAYNEFRRSVSVQSNMSAMGDNGSFDGDRMSKLLMLDSFEQRQTPVSEGSSTRSGLPSTSSTADLGSADTLGTGKGITMRPATDTGNLLADLKSSAEGVGLEWLRFKTMFRLRFLLKARHRLSLLLRLLLPVVMTVLAIGLFYATVKSVDDDQETGKRVRLDGVRDLVYVNDTGQNIDTQLDRLGRETVHQNRGIDYRNVGYINSESDRESVLDILSQNGDEYKMLYNYTCGVALTQLTSLVLHAARATVRTTSAADLHLAQNFSAWLQPWPKLEQSSATVVHNWIPLLLLGVALAVTPTLFAASLVDERRKRITRLLYVSGVSRLVYWISAFLADLLEFSIGALILAIICSVSQMEIFEEEGAILALFVMIVLYVPASILWAYVTSFAFNRRLTCCVVLPAITVAISVAAFCAVHFLDRDDTTTAARIIHTVSTICFPPYIGFGALHYISRVKTAYEIDRHASERDIPTGVFLEFEFNVAICYVMLGVYMVVLPPLLALLDSYLSDVWVAPSCNNNNDYKPTNDHPTGDASVEAEKQRVKNILSGNESWPQLVVNGLSRVFKRNGARVLALRDACFTVGSGEVLGLLGPQGAGKTTAVNTMIGLCPPSHGSVAIDSEKVIPGSRRACSKIGFCPQRDSLWNCLTVDEHLDVFGAVRGLKTADIDTVRYSLYRDLDLNVHRAEKTSLLSDVDKRKLSFAVSVLGQKSVVLLDEPSAGIDIRARRQFWDAMSPSLKADNRCAIVTTHCVEEAEALCSRVGVMVNGDIRCLGSPEELKSQYGNTYTLELRLREGDQSTMDRQMDMILLLLKEVFPDMTAQDQFRGRAVFKVKANPSELSLANTFETLESLKRNLGLEDYSFSQPTIEQVYLDLARQQREGQSRFFVQSKHTDAEDSESTNPHTDAVSHRTRSEADARETDPKTSPSTSSVLGYGNSDSNEATEQRRSNGVVDAASVGHAKNGADGAVGVVISFDDNDDGGGAGCGGGGGGGGGGGDEDRDGGAATPVTFALCIDEGVDNPAFTDDSGEERVVEQTSV